MNNGIFVIDTPGATNEKCKCKNQAMFILGVNGQISHLCTECMADLGKRIIDGLA